MEEGFRHGLLAELGTSAAVTLTFLDAYSLDRHADTELELGENADFAEHYVNDDLYFTDRRLPNAVNHKLNCLNGGGHSYPIEWYADSIAIGFANTGVHAGLIDPFAPDWDGRDCLGLTAWREYLRGATIDRCNDEIETHEAPVYELFSVPLQFGEQPLAAIGGDAPSEPLGISRVFTLRPEECGEPCNAATVRLLDLTYEIVVAESPPDRLRCTLEPPPGLASGIELWLNNERIAIHYPPESDEPSQSGFTVPWPTDLERFGSGPHELRFVYSVEGETSGEAVLRMVGQNIDVRDVLESSCGTVDRDRDGRIDLAERLYFIERAAQGDADADVTGDRRVNIFDVLEVLKRSASGC